MINQFSVDDVITILKKIPGPDDPILVGGQALNFWADYYVENDGALREFEPFTSKDVDFLGGIDAAVALKEVWQGEIYLPTIDDHTPQIAKVTFSLEDGREVELDFLGVIMGLDESVVRKNAVKIQLSTDEQYLSIMHPIHCLASRLHNVYGYLSRRSHPNGEHEVKRVQLAVRVLKHTIIQTFDNELRDKGDYKVIEALADMSLTQVSNQAFSLDGIDILEAIPDCDSMSDEFLHKRLPQIQQQTAEKRERYIHTMNKVGAIQRVQDPLKKGL